MPESVPCSRVAVLVERTLLGGQCAEQPIEQKEADAKVPVHQSPVIQHSVMDVVQPSAALKPTFEYRIALHPEILDMHPIVEVVEHYEAPSNDRREKNQLVKECNFECPQNDTRDHQQNGSWGQPLDSNISDREPVHGRVNVVLAGTLLL
jgi:hypothetical protein